MTPKEMTPRNILAVSSPKEALPNSVTRLFAKATPGTLYKEKATGQTFRLRRRNNPQHPTKYHLYLYNSETLVEVYLTTKSEWESLNRIHL